MDIKNGISVIKITQLKTWTAEWTGNNKISDEETKPKKSAKMKNDKNMQTMRKKIKRQETHPDRPTSILIRVSEKKINNKRGKKCLCLEKGLENIQQALNSSYLWQ